MESGSELLYGAMAAQASVVRDTRYYELYSTTYTQWLDEAASQCARYGALLERIHDQPITMHEECAPDVMKTTFANGISVLVNYTDTPQTIDGVLVEGGDFTAIEGGVPLAETA